MLKLLRFLEKRFIEPSARISNPEDREKSRILAILQLTLLVLGTAFIMGYELSYPVNRFSLDVDFIAKITVIVLFILLYVLNRKGYLALSSIGVLVLTTAAIFLVAFPHNQSYVVEELFIFFNIPILLAHFLLKQKMIIIISVFIILSTILYVPFSPVYIGSHIWDYIAFNIIFSILIFLLTQHRNRLEKLRTEETKRLEKQYRTLVENIPDIIARYNSELRYTYISDNVYNITGLKPEIFIGKTNREIGFMEEVAANSMKRIEEVFEKGQPAHDVFSLRTPKGNFIFDCRTIPEFDPAGKVCSVFGILRNITEQQRAEEQLRQTQKMEAIGQLAGGIAHDFNNQLTGIVGLTELLSLELKDAPALREYAQDILTSAKRASDTANKLLAFARKGNVVSEVVDLHSLVSEVLSLLKHSIDKRIVLKQNLSAHPSTTIGDPSQLQNALLNLAINACDAMRSGGTLAFETATVKAPGNPRDPIPINLAPGEYIRISIIDTGIGIEKSIQERIFEPFFTTKDRGQGTGLGLAAVYGIVENHRGAITVESEQGKGSTFFVFLPAENVPLKNKQAESPTPQSRRRKGKILLIDDEIHVVETISRMLRWIGYDVESYTHNVSALDFYREHAPAIDLIILDMMMPIMTGSEVFTKLKEINPKARILLCSGFSMDGECENLINQGAAGFLQKPFRMAALAEKLAPLLHHTNDSSGS